MNIGEVNKEWQRWNWHFRITLSQSQFSFTFPVECVHFRAFCINIKKPFGIENKFCYAG